MNVYFLENKHHTKKTELNSSKKAVYLKESPATGAACFRKEPPSEKVPKNEYGESDKYYRGNSETYID